MLLSIEYLEEALCVIIEALNVYLKMACLHMSKMDVLILPQPRSLSLHPHCLNMT